MARVSPPPVPGVADRPERASPSDLLAALLRGPDEPERGSAETGRDIIRRLERWAHQDPRVAPMVAKALDALEGAASSSDSDTPPAGGPRLNDTLGPGGGSGMRSPI